MGELAAEVNVSIGTVFNVVHEDLSLKFFFRGVRHLLTERQKQIQLKRSVDLLTLLKHQLTTVKLFTDKKNFAVGMVNNAVNDHFLAPSASDIPPVMWSKYPASVLVLSVITSNGKKMPPCFFPQGPKVGTKDYLEVLQKKVKPWVDQEFPLWTLHWPTLPT